MTWRSGLGRGTAPAMNKPTEPSKRDVCLTLLEARPSIFVHLDPRRPGVAVPPGFAKQAHLVLQIGLSMPVPIPDLAVNDDGIVATLSFQRTPFTCRMPWSAVFGLFGDDQRGYVWKSDVPSDASVGQPAKARPALRVVKEGTVKESVAKASAVDESKRGNGPASEPAPPVRALAPKKREQAAQKEGGPPDAPRPRPPHLRRIK